MKFIIYSPAFHPLIGGLETVVQVLATEWTQIGIDVTVITHTPADGPEPFPFQVLRQANFIKKVCAYREADAVLFANISLWGMLPLLFCGSRRPAWIATHQGCYENFGQKIKPFDRVKKFLTRYASANISCSAAVDRFLGLKAYVIPNPYDSSLFRILPEASRTGDLVFLGRLVTDKGVDLLLDALATLRDDGITPSLTVVGSGPELKRLETQVLDLNLTGQVRFTGARSGADLVRILNEHRILVVPSRWNEPFGIVALEGIGCGCLVVGSNGGGLPEAIGPCGLTFENGDGMALAGALRTALGSSLPSWTTTETIFAHLARHEAGPVAEKYHQIIRSVS